MYKRVQCPRAAVVSRRVLLWRPLVCTTHKLAESDSYALKAAFWRRGKCPIKSCENYLNNAPNPVAGRESDSAAQLSGHWRPGYALSLCCWCGDVWPRTVPSYTSEIWREVLGRDTRVGNAFFKLARELRTRAVERSYLNWLELTRCHAITFARELSAIDSVVVWLIQLLPEEDEPCCSVWASLVAAGGTVMAYVPSGVSTALRKYLFPICAKLSCACPV
jgi:hypothetical protein